MFTHGTNNYLCSATAVTNTVTGRSMIITAAHCVYDDAAKKVCYYIYWHWISVLLRVCPSLFWVSLKVLTSYAFFPLSNSLQTDSCSSHIKMMEDQTDPILIVIMIVSGVVGYPLLL